MISPNRRKVDANKNTLLLYILYKNIHLYSNKEYHNVKQ